jgi:hypothetical protein
MQPLQVLDDLSKINQCFFDADKLSEEAYSILKDFPLTPASITHFTAAVLIANAKHTEANLRWDVFKSNRKRAQT